jgi:hypothetical protein
MAVDSLDAARLAVADPDIVDHCIEPARSVRLIRDVAHGRER